MNIQALRWCPERGYEITLTRAPYEYPGRAISNRLAALAPRTLGGEPLHATALRYPNTWCAVHPSQPWIEYPDGYGCAQRS